MARIPRGHQPHHVPVNSSITTVRAGDSFLSTATMELSILPALLTGTPSTSTISAVKGRRTGVSGAGNPDFTAL